MIRHHYGYRCTGRQASCTCGFRGPIHTGPKAQAKATKDLKAHAAEVRAAETEKP